MRPSPKVRSKHRRDLSPIAALLVLLAVRGQAWALDIEQCVSDDGHVYVILTTRTSAVGTQVTSLALTQGSAAACVKQAGTAGSVVSAFAGALGPGLGNRVRTTVLSGFSSNTVSCASNFDPQGAGGKGVLYLPGPYGRTVSAAPEESTEGVVPVQVADDLVPAAVDVRHIMRPGMRCRGDTMAFPYGGNGRSTSNGRYGEARNQAITFDDTRDSRMGNEASQDHPDGFLLQGNCSSMATCQMIVFVGELGSGCETGPSVSAAGFSVDGNMATAAAEAAMQTGSTCAP